jgi:hypothetical protein
MKAHELAKKLLEGPDLPVYSDSAPWGNHEEIKHIIHKERKKKKKTAAGGMLEFTDGDMSSDYLLLDHGVPIL